jgi:hypothetical protein
MSVNKRKCLSIREKVEIIRELESGEKMLKYVKNLIYRHLQFQLYRKQRSDFIWTRKQLHYKQENEEMWLE